MITHHTHRARRATEVAYTGPVACPQVPAAHGGVTILEFCSCGASRAVNVNGRHRERSGWLDRAES